MSLFWLVKAAVFCYLTFTFSSGLSDRKEINKTIIVFLPLAGSRKDSASHGQHLQHPQPAGSWSRLQDQHALQHGLQGLWRASVPHGGGEYGEWCGCGAWTPCRRGQTPSYAWRYLSFWLFNKDKSNNFLKTEKLLNIIFFTADQLQISITTSCFLLLHQIREINMYKGPSVTFYKLPFSPDTMLRCWEECKAKSDYSARRKAIEQFNQQNRWKKRGMSIIPIKYGIAFLEGFLNQVCGSFVTLLVLKRLLWFLEYFPSILAHTSLTFVWISA